MDDSAIIFDEILDADAKLSPKDDAKSNDAKLSPKDEERSFENKAT